MVSVHFLGISGGEPAEMDALNLSVLPLKCRIVVLQPNVIPSWSDIRLFLMAPLGRDAQCFNLPEM